MRILYYFVVISIFWLSISALAQQEVLLIDDFEGPLAGGPDGTVDFGSGGDSSVELTAATDIKHSGNQSMKIVYNAAPGGYMWIARGFDLDAANTQWLIKPQDIDWAKYSSISFYMYGTDSKANIAFDIKDNGNEMWRFMIEDHFQGWKQIICPFNNFFARGDWQPHNADKNANLDFPIKSFQFEPLPVSEGTFYFDGVSLL